MTRWGVLLALLLACSPQPLELVAVTFNTGTTEGLPHDDPPDDGYSSAEAVVSDAYYGDGLAWRDVVDDTIAWFADTRPDIVAFQEVFYSGECADIPAEHHAGWVCETWQEGDPTVAQVVLGEGFQVACHAGKPDKCIAVRRELGVIAGCDGDLCLDGLAGVEVDGCGSGSRVGRAEVRLADGDLTVINVHGSSGFTQEDMACRRQQFEAAFSLLGERNLMLGDLNTDPGRSTGFDDSAAAFAEGARAAGLTYHTDVGPDADPTYLLYNIDHVLSDVFEGGCQPDTVTDVVYFDHLPEVCALTVLP